MRGFRKQYWISWKLFIFVSLLILTSRPHCLVSSYLFRQGHPGEGNSNVKWCVIRGKVIRLLCVRVMSY